MRVPFADALRRFTLSRLVRALVKEQRRTADALERQTHILDAIGRILAANSNRSWPVYAARPAEDTFADESSVGMPDDQWFADLEAIKLDYEARFGRSLTDEDVLRVYADHQSTRESHEDRG